MYGFHFGFTLLAPRNLFLREDHLVKLIKVGRKIEQFEIANYKPLCAEAERMEFTHVDALLTSILNQEKHANELLGALGQGKGPLDQLIKKVVLEHVGATKARGACSVAAGCICGHSALSMHRARNTGT